MDDEDNDLLRFKQASAIGTMSLSVYIRLIFSAGRAGDVSVEAECLDSLFLMGELSEQVLFLCHLEIREFKSWRDGAADKGVVCVFAGGCGEPDACWYGELDGLSCEDVLTHDDFLIFPVGMQHCQPHRSPEVEVPHLILTDTVEMGTVAGFQQEQDAG